MTLKITFDVLDYYEAQDRLLGRDGGRFPDHLITINDPERDPPRGVSTVKGEVLALSFHDLRSTGDTFGSVLACPQASDVAKIITFGKKVGLEGGHLLVHCRAGISRSTAATLIVLATQSEPHQALELERRVIQNRPISNPNDLMLQMADEMLNWGGVLAGLGGDVRGTLYETVG